MRTIASDTFRRWANIGFAGLAVTTLLSVGLFHGAALALAPPNQDFEAGTTGWGPMSGSAIASVTSPVHGGAKALSMKRSSSSGVAGVTDKPNVFTSLATGTVCTATAWVNGPSGKTATVKLIAKNGSTRISTVAKTITLTGQWIQLPQASLTVSGAANMVDLQFSTAAMATSQVWYIDDVSASCNNSSPTPPPTTPPTSSGATDVAMQTGLYDGTPYATYGAYPYDYDNDGLTDVLIDPHNVAGGSRLYHNDGNGHFTQVYKGQFVTVASDGTIRKDHHGCAWGDVNVDGLPDFYCTMGANHGTLTDKANELWIQQPGGGFVNEVMQYGVADPTGPGRTAVFIDVNHDNYPDLYVTNGPRSDGTFAPDRLFINQGGTSFRDATEYGADLAISALPGNQCFSQAIDYNHDGWQDLFICGNKGVKLLRNNNGTSFTDVTATTGIATGQWRSAVMADLNNDGILDLAGLDSQGTHFRIQMGTADGTFAAPTSLRTLPGGRQIAVGDTNGDGYLDIFIVQSGTNPNILMVNSGNGTAYNDAVVPQVSSGDGESVNPFDYNQDGIMDFVVMHGYESTSGPVQLITFPKP